ncbi:MAG: hypothetical protein C0402_02015 [Thermodesulfovibrio sp.]|nr:hypothetical protein [Thermodesulfovibrio sp.]
MKVEVNDCAVSLFPPMTTVRHALLTAGLMEEVEAGGKVYDEWGNEAGLDGSLQEGAKLYVR